MSLIIDIIMLLAAAAAIIRGASRGFLKSVMHFASLIIAIICVITFTQPLSQWFGEKFINTSIMQIAEDSLNSIVNAGTENFSIDKIFSDRPEALVSLSEKFSCNLDELSEYYSETLKSLSPGDAIKELSQKIVAATTSSIGNILAAIIIFIAVMLICKLVTYILDLIFCLPVLKQLNRFLGLLFGIVSALVTTWLIANAAVGLINAFSAIRSDIFNESVISNSFILNFFFNNNLILIK